MKKISALSTLKDLFPLCSVSVFDYTEWRKKYFADVYLETFLNEAAEYGKAHPFRGGKYNG